MDNFIFMSQLPTKLSNRLFSLDALRGFDMFWIMGAEEIVHTWNKASGNSLVGVFANQLTHPDWNGFSAYDLIFPLFLFLAGVSTPYSIGNQLENGETKNRLLLRVIKRGLILVLFGILYNNGIEHLLPINEIRFPSVLGRIGLAYIFANIIYLYCSESSQKIWFITLLIGYWLLLIFTSAPGHSAGDLTMEGNIVSYIDRIILPGRLHKEIHDPEGLLSTIPAISTGLLGIMVGSFLRNSRVDQTKKAIYMAFTGVIFILLAQIWNSQFPINKNLWTSSFVLQVGGLSLLLLSLFYYIIDVLGYQRWAFFFRVIGMNSILIYMSSVFIDWEFTAKAGFGWLAQLIGNPFNIVALSIAYVFIKWLFLYFLYKKKIFLRV